ncbi:GNAT family N-acetyltransferase [Microcoleus sp. B7-D4]|uniref:GNAT family N-acetyltransferase n=1 Tax=Microcoleus sp. B7-D4 TaxID=2818696 RepID=UPI002FD61EFE
MLNLSPPAPLTLDHDLSAFDCGKSPLNEFLKLHALDKQNAKISRTYVVTTNAVVVAYYTLALIVVKPEEAPKKVGRGMPSSIPALLMARFAVDDKYQGKGLGRSLLMDAIIRTRAVMNMDSENVPPVRCFVVDAMDEQAKAFYERFDLLPSPSNPMRLFLHYKEIERLFSGE